MAFLGMRGNGDWLADARPKSWREMILFYWPNGDVPLTGITSKLGSEKTTDPEFNWFTKALPSQGGAVASVYLNSTLATEYTTGGAAGDVVYAKVAAAVASEFRPGHQVLLHDDSDYRNSANAKVLSVVQNGASSYIACRLLEADPTTTGLASCDKILVIGNMNPEGGAMPSAIAYDPVKLYNYTQIFRTPLSITRTARKTKLRTGDQYQQAKNEALKLHGLEMEKAFIWGIRTENTGENGKPERTTRGLIDIAKNYGLANDYTLNEDYDATTWVDGGEDWLEEQFEIMFRYGGDRLALVGSGAILGINKLVKSSANYELKTKQTDYGIKIKEWHTPFGTVHMKIHPLFSYLPTFRNSMLCLDPADLKAKVIDDTTFYADPDKQNTGRGRIDGTDEEYLTEIGLEYQLPIKTAFLNGIGEDNPA